MQLSICTISFRHQLISLDEIVDWAGARKFSGVELWGVHARNLRGSKKHNHNWLSSRGLKISMISDYLPLDGGESGVIEKLANICDMAAFWNAPKIRTFAGNLASKDISSAKRKIWVNRIRNLCQVAESRNVNLVVEIHPNTLADTLVSTTELLEDVAHPNLKINFDVIHVWEAGDDPKIALTKLAPYVKHMHLKNIRRRQMLNVFDPANVYAPAGIREGMVSVFDGAFDFNSFLRFLFEQKQVDHESLDVSLEWFGPEVLVTLEKDRFAIQALMNSYGLSGSGLEEKSVLAV